MLNLKTVKNFLKEHNVRPLKRLGQNFLIDKRVLKEIVKTSCISSKDIVLEIGPGTGNLTKVLAEKAKIVIAVEKDHKMIEILKGCKNVKIIQGDILKFNPKRLSLNAKPYKVVANLPYYITAPVIRKFLETEFPPKLIVLMIQKEVAQRITAKPPDMNLLAVSVQFYAKPEIISYISKKSFWPKPKVDSAIIKIIPKKLSVNQSFIDSFFKIVKAGFSQPRKQILNNLSKELKLDKAEVKSWLEKNKIKGRQRAETLSIKDWKNLTKSFYSIVY